MSNNSHFSPDTTSLAFAEEVASVLGIPFDKAATKQESIDLLSQYYSDICQVLPKETQNCRFDSFASRDFRAFFGLSRNSPYIQIDEQWSLFLFGANILICIRTCVALDKDECQENTDLFAENLKSLSDPYLHEVFREKMRPLFLKHSAILPLANLITICMFGFMLCHELAHHNLSHIKLKQESLLEFEADTLGFGYLNQLSFQFEKLKFLKIPPNMLSAPIISMMYLDLLEHAGFIPIQLNTHPLSIDRADNLHQKFDKIADENARYLYKGLRLSYEELASKIKS